MNSTHTHSLTFTYTSLFHGVGRTAKTCLSHTKGTAFTKVKPVIVLSGASQCISIAFP